MDKKYYMTWNAFDIACSILKEQICATSNTYSAIYGLPRGGLTLGVKLSHLLSIPLLSSLDDVFLYYKEGKKVLIVDEISDTGQTLKMFSDKFDIATLYTKPTSITQPTFTAAMWYTSEWIIFPWEIEMGN